MLKDFRTELIILLRFLLIGIVLFFGYQLYLNFYKGQCDPFTRMISDQVFGLLRKSGFAVTTKDMPELEAIWFYFRGTPITQMVEGCNAVSIMILFLSFIFAFYKGAKTFAFVLCGLVFLYAINVARIWLINIAAIEYPQYFKSAHDYLFPAVIYGGVVVLWLVWIKFFVLKKDENS